MDVRFTRDGSEPSYDDDIYIGETYVDPSESIVIRLFDKNGRGGRHIELDRIYIEEIYLNSLENKVLK